MAAAVRTRNAYSPVSVEDTGQDRLIRADSRTSVTKPRRGLSVWTILLLIVGLCLLFLLGFCLGFYIRESQTQSAVDDIIASCEGRRNEEDMDDLAQTHDDTMYRVRGENVRQFMKNFTYPHNPVSGSVVEKRLEQSVRRLLQDYMVNNLEVEEHDVPVTYADPSTPNELQVLDRGTNTVTNITLKNDNVNRRIVRRSTSDLITEDWKFPFVVHSPAGTVEGSLVYGHYGSEADLLILQAKRVSLKNRIVLLRLGKTSLAEKVQRVAQQEAGGVLVYWDPADASDNPAYPANTSYIPYASAAVYTSESYHALVPTIPVQTISTQTAAVLLQQLGSEEGTVRAPAAWSGGLGVGYVIGRKFNNGNVTIRLSVYNKEKRQVVRNIISNIHGLEEKDRYVVVGAPRASLPGVSQDALTSTALLMQVASALNHAFQDRNWRPRRGIKIVSWGGADIGNMGMLEHMKTHHHLLSQRAVAYFDLSQLVIGDDVVTARVSPGLYQVVNEVTMAVPDPKQTDFSIQSSWQDRYKSGIVTDPVTVPLSSYHSDRSATPFLHALGVTSVSLQYRDSDSVVNDLSVSNINSFESQHHYKYHTAVTRVMIQVILSMVDNDIIPFSLTGAANELHNILWQTSQTLKSCSKSIQDLDNILTLSKELQQTASVFEDLIQLYKEKQYKESYRMINDVKLLFERLFVVHSDGVPHHIVYPTDSDSTMSGVAELCEAGDLPEVWDAVEKFSETLRTVLTEAISALRTTN